MNILLANTYILKSYYKAKSSLKSLEHSQVKSVSTYFPMHQVKSLVIKFVTRARFKSKSSSPRPHLCIQARSRRLNPNNMKTRSENSLTWTGRLSQVPGSLVSFTRWCILADSQMVVALWMGLMMGGEGGGGGSGDVWECKGGSRKHMYKSEWGET